MNRMPIELLTIGCATYYRKPNGQMQWISPDNIFREKEDEWQKDVTRASIPATTVGQLRPKTAATDRKTSMIQAEKLEHLNKLQPLLVH